MEKKKTGETREAIGAETREADHGVEGVDEEVDDTDIGGADQRVEGADKKVGGFDEEFSGLYLERWNGGTRSI